MQKGCYIPVICDDCDKAPTIGENGNWFIGEEDTGVKAQGEDGEPGTKGDKGDPGIQGPVGPQGPKGDQAADMSRIEAMEAEIAKLNSDLENSIVSVSASWSGTTSNGWKKILSNLDLTNYSAEEYTVVGAYSCGYLNNYYCIWNPSFILGKINTVHGLVYDNMSRIDAYCVLIVALHKK